jgi:hypothetical protein
MSDWVNDPGWVKPGTKDDTLQPDWTRWEDERTSPYIIRLVSQVVWAAGDFIDQHGAATRDRLWAWADELLDIAHPQQPPIDIDMNTEGNT